MITMRKGDLIYIPQAVDLWDVTEGSSAIKYFKTEKPQTGVFIRMDAFNTCRVYVKGQETSVALKSVYPMEDRC